MIIRKHCEEGKRNKKKKKNTNNKRETHIRSRKKRGPRLFIHLERCIMNIVCTTGLPLTSGATGNTAAQDNRMLCNLVVAGFLRHF